MTVLLEHACTTKTPLLMRRNQIYLDLRLSWVEGGHFCCLHCTRPLQSISAYLRSTMRLNMKKMLLIRQAASASILMDSPPTVILPTSLVPEIDVLMTGICSASSAWNTLQQAHEYMVNNICLAFVAYENSGQTWKQSGYNASNEMLALAVPVEVLRSTDSHKTICIRQLGEYANIVAILKLHVNHDIVTAGSPSAQDAVDGSICGMTLIHVMHIGHAGRS